MSKRRVSIRDRAVLQLQRLAVNKDVRACLIIILVILFANSVYLFLTNQNPLLQRSALPLTTKHATYLRGQNTIDPNDGFTSQALGTAAVNQLLQGKLPLWNHFEGVGSPLAGEMQSAALFPYTLLLALPAGSLLVHIALELTAALGMYCLLRKLRLSIKASIVGGLLFGLNGTFAWLTNAAFNPIAFLPWLVLGVEVAREASLKRHLGGFVMIAVSLALSLYAGFPETAYIDGLLVAVWAIVRLFGLEKQSIRTYIGSLLSGGVLGLSLAAPVLVAFVAYLPYAYTGGHGGSGFSGLGLTNIGFPALFMPYIYGTISGLNDFDSTNKLLFFWGNVGGYVTAGASILALFGVFSRQVPRGLRIALAVWVVLAISRIFAVPVITQLIDHIPAISLSAVFRYITPSVSFALIVLAAVGLQKALDHKPPKKLYLWVGGGWLLFLCVATAAAYRHDMYIATGPHHRFWLLGSASVAFVVTAIVLWGLQSRHAFVKAWVVPIAVICETVGLFLIPQLSAPVRPATVDKGAVQFLQAHIGNDRFYTLGPIAPNYGSYFGIASINNNDLPVPSLWANYITSHLDKNTNPILFTGNFMNDPKGMTPKQALFVNIKNYANAGVKYVVANAGSMSLAEIEQNNFEQVYNDGLIAIYQLPQTRSYATADNCTVTLESKDEMKTSCSQPSTLTRLELYFPGWSVRVNSTDTQIYQSDIYQSISLPKGVATVKFTYAPRGMTIAIILFWLSAVTILWALLDNTLKKWYKVIKNNQ